MAPGCSNGPGHDQLLERLDVPARDLVRDGELLRDLERDSDLADVEARVGADDRPAGEVDPLSGERPSEPAFLSLEPLAERLERPSGAVVGLRDAGDLVVEVGGDVVVEQVDEVLDDEVRRPRLLGLPDPLVDAEDVHYLVGEVVLRPDAGL